MKPVARLRKRPLAACLAIALAIGVPAVVESASAPAARLDRLRLAQQPVPNGAVTAVANCDDGGPGSLRDAIAGASDGAHIDLRSLACSSITLDTAIPVGAISVYLDGPGPGRLTIDGGGATRLFEANSGGALWLSDLRLANGYAAGDGGCILSTGTVWLVDSLITGCHAHTGPFQARGGAISASSVGVLRSRVIANIVESDSSFAKGGGFYAQNSTTSYSTIDSNEARSTYSKGFGGGAFLRHGGVIDGSAVTRNRANNAAGLSFLGDASDTVNLKTTTVSGNIAEDFIGGVYVRPSAIIVNSTIASNCANQTEVTTGYFSAVGIELYQSSSLFSSTIVANNALCATSHAPEGTAYDVAARGAGAFTGDHNLVVTSNTPLPPDTIRDDPMLAPLADNGGHNETQALLPGSPAIDTGDARFAYPWDGRWHWYPRVDGPAPDIGAFEATPTGTVRQATNCDDSGAGSLRDLAASAISGDTIDLTHLSCSRITLTSGAIQSDANHLKITGPGATLLTIDGGGLAPIIEHAGVGPIELRGLAFENGYAGDGSLLGGGCVLSAGLVSTTDATFSACVAHTAMNRCYGGAIRARGAALYRTKISDSRCTSDSDFASGGGIAVDYDLTLVDATIANNVVEAAAAADAIGGGFVAGVEANVERSTITGNTAALAGAGYAPELVVSDSTVSGNTASVQAGGIAASIGTLDNSTIAFNTTGADAAAGFFAIARGDLESTIVFGNTSGASAYDVGTQTGALFGADNLIGASPSALPPGTIHDDPLLGPLQDNGGATWTHALGDESPALDAGNNLAGLTSDQRGGAFVRVFNGRADIGAIEMQPEPVDVIFANGFD